MNGSLGHTRPGLRAWFASAFALVAAIAVTPASAQAPRPDRPYRGLFGSGLGNFEQQLTANGSLGSSYDDNLLAEALGSNVPRISDLNSTHRGVVGNASGSLNYSLTRGRVSAHAAGGTFERYYPTLATTFIRRDYANGGLNVDIGKGLSVGAQAAYLPYNLRGLFSSLLDPRGADTTIEEDFPSSTEHYAMYSGNAGFSHSLSLRTTVDLDTAYRVRESSARAARFSTWSGGGGLSHNLTKDLSLRLGYRRMQARYDSGNERPLNQTIDAGVNFNHALSITRRTTVSFSTGTTILSSHAGERTRFRLIGNAELSHEIGRTWSAALIYNRGVLFMDSWPEPVFSDSITSGLSGLITQRLQVQANVRAGVGGRAYNNSTITKFHTYYGGAGISYALNRFVSANVNYAYYNHRFADSVLLAPGFPHRVDRRSVRFYVSLWAPVFQRSRRQ